MGVGQVLFWEELLKELESKFHQNIVYEILKELRKVVLNIPCTEHTQTTYIAIF